MKNLGQMMKQAQELQTKMAQAQEEISTIEVEANVMGISEVICFTLS